MGACTKLTWDRQFARLAPILERPGAGHAQKLRDFIREFFLGEAAEADLLTDMLVAHYGIQ